MKQNTRTILFFLGLAVDIILIYITVKLHLSTWVIVGFIAGVLWIAFFPLRIPTNHRIPRKGPGEHP